VQLCARRHGYVSCGGGDVKRVVRPEAERFRATLRASCKAVNRRDWKRRDGSRIFGCNDKHALKEPSPRFALLRAVRVNSVLAQILQDDRCCMLRPLPAHVFLEGKTQQRRVIAVSCARKSFF
jgi:hypothetical protein